MEHHAVVRIPAALVLGVLLSACGTQEAGGGKAATAPPPSAHAVLRDGDSVTATGRIVHVPGGPVRLCAPQDEAGMGPEPGSEPPTVMCQQGLDLAGADLSTLTDRRERAGAVEGWARIVGVLHGDAVQVEQQSPARRDGRPDDDLAPPLRDVPCPAPEGGWPRDPSILRGPGDVPEGDANLDRERPTLDAYRAAHPAEFVDIAYLRPFPDSVLLGVVALHEQARADIEQALRPTYGDRLCVVVSRYSADELRAVGSDVSALWRDAARHGLRGSGTTVGDDLQRRVDLFVVRVTDELLALVRRHPRGLVHLEPWLVQAPER